MSTVAFVRVEWLIGGGQPGLSDEEQAEILADNVKRLIEGVADLTGGPEIEGEENCQYLVDETSTMPQNLSALRTARRCDKR